MSTIYTVCEFEKLSEPAKRSLWFLRGLRDALADYFISGSSDEDFHGKIEELCGYLWARPYNLRDRILRHHDAVMVGQFDLLWHIVKRIALLEREACGAYISSDLQAA